MDEFLIRWFFILFFYVIKKEIHYYVIENRDFIFTFIDRVWRSLYTKDPSPPSNFFFVIKWSALENLFCFDRILHQNLFLFSHVLPSKICFVFKWFTLKIYFCFHRICLQKFVFVFIYFALNKMFLFSHDLPSKIFWN